jgi:predicted Zn-dependent protease
VGSGVGGGGLLNGIGGSGNGGAQQQVLSQQEQDAKKAIKLHPNDPQGWSALVRARYESAGQGSDYNVNTSSYTGAGKQELTAATQAWQRYLQLTQRPDPDLAILVARAYNAIGDSKNEASAWEIVTAANPTTPTFFEYLAAAAYQAKEIRKGDLAAAKAISLTPKAEQFQLKQLLQQAKAQALSSTQTTTTAK